MAWLAAMLLAGCANTSKLEHAVGYLNVGAVSIYDIEVTYGQAVIPFKGQKLSRRSGGWGVRMPIQDQMTVTWHTDQATPPHHIAIAELRSKVSRSYELKNRELRFNADKLELWREEATGPHNPNTDLQPRQYVKVFP